MKRFFAIFCTTVLALSAASCAAKPKETVSSEPPVNVSAPESGVQSEIIAETEISLAINGGECPTAVWRQAADFYTELHPGIAIKLIEGADSSADIVYSPSGDDAALAAEKLADITSLLDVEIDGAAIRDKLVPGIVDTVAADPYDCGRIYYMPIFCRPCGLWYNADLFEENGYEIPKTWDALLALGEEAEADGLSLFTYPAAGYLEPFFLSMIMSLGGADFYNDVITYQNGVWETVTARRALELAAALSEYIAPETIYNSNSDKYTENEKAFFEGNSLFMAYTPNFNELAERYSAKGNYRVMPTPAYGARGDRCVYSYCERLYMQNTENVAAAAFAAFCYSDAAEKIFAENGFYTPVKGDAYEDGATAAVGVFARSNVENVSMKDALCYNYDKYINDEISMNQWQGAIERASDKLRISE